MKGFQHIDPPEEESRHSPSIIIQVLILDYLASYQVTIPNCVFTTAQKFIQEVLIPTLQQYHTQNRHVTRFHELKDPDNIAKMELYSGTTPRNAQAVVVPTGVTDLYTFVGNAGFRALRGKAT